MSHSRIGRPAVAPLPQKENNLEFLRAQRDKHFALLVHDPQPVEEVAGIWTSAAQMATIGIFVLLLLACLYFSRGLLLPVMAAAIISTALSPLMKKATANGIPRWVAALVLVGATIGVAALGITLLAAPLTEWVARAPEFGAAMKQKLQVFDAPLAALRELQSSLSPRATDQVKVESQLTELAMSAIAIVTPAATQSMLFVVSLIFFLIGQLQFRNVILSMLPSHDAKLRCLKIVKDVERNIASQLAVVTLINLGLGLIVAFGAWLIGFPNPLIFGVLAAILNYIPYIGPAIMIAILFAVGLVVFPSLGEAMIAPMGFVVLATIEGQFVMPTLVGRKLTLNPLAIFLAVAFWAWLWGPFGAFFAVPLSIVGLVTMNHLFPDEDPTLPD